MMEAPRRKGCVACGQPVDQNTTNWCDECWPTVCVCPLPDPDGVGECRNCQMAYRPVLMELRDQWIAYLDSKGVKRGFVRTSTG